MTFLLVAMSNKYDFPVGCYEQQIRLPVGCYAGTSRMYTQLRFSRYVTTYILVDLCLT